MFRYLKLIAFILFPMLGLTSCGGDEPDSPSRFETETPGSESDPIADIVKNNISATVSYSDYSWNMTINSKLAGKFPGKTLTYGTECGYDAYQYYHHFNFKTAYLEKTDGQGNMSICFSVFAGNEYAEELLYWYSYKELKYRKDKGERLDSDEVDLYNAVLYYMKKAESSAKSSYCGRLYVIIDGKKYFYYTYGKIPSGSGSGGSSGGSGSGGSSSSYEKPELSFVDYDCTTTSITAKFRIDNQSKAKVSSVKGYYGKSSASTSTSATLSGSLITVKVSGLTKGTTYYIKCSATGPGGTTTSDQIKLSTLY